MVCLLLYTDKLMSNLTDVLFLYFYILDFFFIVGLYCIFQLTMGCKSACFLISPNVNQYLKSAHLRLSALKYKYYFILNCLSMCILRVTLNSRRFDAWMGGAWFDSQSHSRIFAGCYDHAILALWGCSNVWFHRELPVFSQYVNAAYYDNTVNKNLGKKEAINKKFNMHE